MTAFMFYFIKLKNIGSFLKTSVYIVLCSRFFGREVDAKMKMVKAPVFPESPFPMVVEGSLCCLLGELDDLGDFKLTPPMWPVYLLCAVSMDW